jgi:DNA-binding YbaB/EbfC family protein
MSNEKPPFDLEALQGLLGKVMDQARDVQGRMQDVQEKLKGKSVEGSSGGGLVRVVANGSGRVVSVKIEKIAVDPRDVEMLEDLLTAAVNDALRRAQEMVEAELGGLTGGMDLGALGSMMSRLGKPKV